MSRAYQAYIRISNFDPARKRDVIAAARQSWSWDFDGWYSEPNYIDASSDDNLCGGEGEGEFAERVTQDIWAANGAFCSVQIEMTFLENLPCETYELDEDDYARWFADAQKTG